MDFHNLNQGQLATLVGVDRSTVTTWQRAGMPYRRAAENGLAAGYSAGVAIHWKAGHSWAQKSRINLSAGQKVAIGWLFGCGSPTAADRDLFAQLVDQAGLNDDPGELLAYARGVLDLAGRR